MNLLRFSWVAMALCCVGTAQDPLVARFVLGDQPTVITITDLAQEIGRRHQRTERGRRALDYVCDLALVRLAAERDRCMPSPAETQTWIDNLRAEMKKSGADLNRQLAQQGMSDQEFGEYAQLSLAHERLVMAAMDLSSRDKVTPELLALWLKEARAKTPIVNDPARLGPSIVARVGDREITVLDLGRALVRSSSPEERLQFCQQIVWLRAVNKAAADRNLTVTPAEAEREVAARRRLFESEARQQKIAFEQVLAAEGTSSQELSKWPVLLGQVFERKIVQHDEPDRQLEQRLQRDRDKVTARFGERRKLQGLLVLVASDEQKPRPLAQREAQALAELEQLRESIRGGAPFDAVARKHSDDTPSRVGGGDLGWCYREGEERVPAAIVAAAFALQLEELSAPVRAGDGYWLVRVTEIEATPADPVLLQRMRDADVMALRKRLVAEAKLQLVSG